MQRAAICEEAARARDLLADADERMQARDQATGETRQELLTEEAKLRERCNRLNVELPEEAAGWTATELGRRERAATELGRRTAEHGREETHVWRGATRRLTPGRIPALGRQVKQAAAALERLAEAWKRGGWAAHLNLDGDRATTAMVREGRRRLEPLLETGGPPAGAARLISPGDRELRIEEVETLCEEIARFQIEDARLQASFTEAARRRSAAAWRKTEAVLKQEGYQLPQRVMDRWSMTYGVMLAQLREGLTGSAPWRGRDRAMLSTQIREHAEAREAIGAAPERTKKRLGTLWDGFRTKTAEVLTGTAWLRAVAAAAADEQSACRWAAYATATERGRKTARELARLMKEYEEAWEKVEEATGLREDEAAGEGTAPDLDTHGARLRELAERAGEYGGWTELREAGERAAALGLRDLRTRIGKGTVRPEDAGAAVRYARAQAAVERLAAEDENLLRPDGGTRTAATEDFRKADGEQAEHNQRLLQHELRRLHDYVNSMKRTAGTAMGRLRREMNKQRRQLSVRKMLELCGETITKVKPVFVMSPLTIAQSLPPGGLEFDLVVMDEASQLRPEEGIGAVLRTKQLIVVGDDQQLPPSSFFDIRQEEAEDGAEGEEAGEPEPGADAQAAANMLNLCQSAGMAEAWLRWHYRSEHGSLMDVSNSAFYKGLLCVPVNPDPAGEGRGLTLSYGPGVYARGAGKNNNPLEAERVLEAVAEHARTLPDLTLGIATMNAPQAELIEDMLRRDSRWNGETQTWFEERGEGFVKPLEQVQGDERHVIFVSIGYGRDANGKMSQNFGPVSQTGGQKRLNVLFTRARKECRIFSSIRHHEIELPAPVDGSPASPATSGRAALREFLHYAETGRKEGIAKTGKGAESPFEEDVADAIGNLGMVATPQLGSGAFRIDVAVSSPAEPGRYLLGVECDGARYHSSRWARDRDRLRQDVLESKRWRIHRIWSTDWFNQREEEIARLDAAIREEQERTRSKEGTAGTRRAAAERGGQAPVEETEAEAEGQPAAAH